MSEPTEREWLEGIDPRTEQERRAEVSEHKDALAEWREQTGVRLMLATKCHHSPEHFGTGAVCDVCFDNVQRIGGLMQEQAAHAWEQGRIAERRDWEFTADEDRTPWVNPYRASDGDA